MISRVYFVLFVAPCILCADNAIDPETIHSVFGYPQQYVAAATATVPSPGASIAQLAQAAPVVPLNGTLTDPDYWDVDELPAAAVADYDKFDWTLTKRVSSTADGNMLLSPLGLKLALAILTEAATGLTKSELASVLGFELDRTAVRRKFSTIIQSLQKESPLYILNLNSRIYVQDTAKLRQRFAAIAKQFYRTDMLNVNFHNASVAAKEINDWVANATHDRITNLVNADDIKDMVVLILNTIYFKGSWRHQFDPNATRSGGFYITPKVQQPVTFMNVKDKFYYTESSKLDAKILRMPYQGNKFAMYLIVPNTLTGLTTVIENLSNIRAEMDNLRERLVDVILPRFKYDYNAQLNEVLRELGVRQAFEDTASFPGISRGQSLEQKLKVDEVLQKSGIEVNELGSVAYSATEISLVNKFGEDDESNVEVIANKPFFFFIQDETTRQLLFTGKVADPRQLNGSFKLAAA